MSRSRTALAVRTLAATAVAVSALSLTACADGSGTRDEGASTLVARTSAQQSTAAQATANRRTAAAKQPVTCTAARTKVKVTPVSRPLNHLLVTATNTGTKPCYAYNAPYLRFDDAQSAAGVNHDSAPQSVVTLAPGESAYAGVTTSAADGSGTHGYTAHRLGLFFSGRAMNGSVGAEAVAELPAAGVYVDSTVTTTYWQSTREAALQW
ncbi:hypothetical protein SALBM135S_03022 [Streptomyces alboniger]